MKRNLNIIAASICVLVLASLLYTAWTAFRGALPLIQPIPDRIPSSSPSTPQDSPNTTGIPLTLPSGFSISVFAEGISNARVMAFDHLGNMWVSQPAQGTVSVLEIEGGRVQRSYPVFRNLNNPHGLAFDPDSPTTLYIAEENKISKTRIYSEDALHKIVDLPGGGGHSTRTLGFGPDKRLYVSIGSSCNVCIERDERRAKIFSMNKDGGNFKEYARGLRNSVFFTWHPETDKMWATDMGRDLLGDDLPPEEINIVEEGKNYGWPICYGKNIHDTDFDKNTYIRNPCMEPFEIPSHVDLQAHSAPLGLAFITSSRWPVEYRGDLLVAYHGSWNRSVPTGYKLVRIKLNGDVHEDTVDFIRGWLSDSQVYGRPVGLLFDTDGNLYVSDDRAGLIYKIIPPAD